MTALEYKEFGKFKVTKSDVFKIFVKFLTFFKNPHFYLTFVITLIFPDFYGFPDFS